MFEYRRYSGNVSDPGPASSSPHAEVYLSGRGIVGRVQMVFAATAISTTEDVTRTAAMTFRRDCPGANVLCILQHISDLVRSKSKYEPDEGAVFGVGSDVDIFRTLKRILSTGGRDCDCAAIATMAILACMDIQTGCRVIEQRGVGDTTYSWSHIWSWALKNGIMTHLELSPRPAPLSAEAPVDWHTPETTYRRHRDFVYDPIAWAAWLAKCDLKKQVFAQFPAISDMPVMACLNCGHCTGKCKR